MLDSAVLFLIFNRPEITERVFQEIRRVRPKRLYIAADGPRGDNPIEAALCQKTREICCQIDWDCEVKTLFRDVNLGCQRAVSSAIDWFFVNETEGIILEDDCLASQSFFRYCSDLLDYYRDEKQVMCISGDNFQQGRNVCDDSYYFSRYPHCWGWATWRDSWSLYDEGMDQWQVNRNINVINQWFDSGEEFRQYWENAFDAAAEGRVDSWSYRWIYSCWLQRGLTCLPHKNLVKNIGFTETATHTKSNVWYSKLERNELSFPLRHPRLIRRNVEADKISDRKVLRIGGKEKKSKVSSKASNLIVSLKRYLNIK